MKIIAVIPARYSSTRFKGKPLAHISGKPMIQHVYERALKVESISEVFVATDDERIFNVVEGFGGKVVMTSPDHASGTDRIAEAINHLNLDDNDIVVNIQGDQPIFKQKIIDDLVEPMIKDSSIPMATLIYKIIKKEEIFDQNHVKVAFDINKFALYFSRSTIPCLHPSATEPVYYKHLGVYAYRKDFLLKFTQLEMRTLEKTEKLEQLRVLEHGYRIKLVETIYDSIEVDNPEDVNKVEEIIEI